MERRGLEESGELDIWKMIGWHNGSPSRWDTTQEKKNTHKKNFFECSKDKRKKERLDKEKDCPRVTMRTQVGRGNGREGVHRCRDGGGGGRKESRTKQVGKRSPQGRKKGAGRPAPHPHIPQEFPI
jgi:hypothetical protein